MPLLKQNPNQLLGKNTEGKVARYVGHMALGVAAGFGGRGEQVVRFEDLKSPKERFERAVHNTARKPFLGEGKLGYTAQYNPEDKTMPSIALGYDTEKDALDLQVSNGDKQPLHVTVQVGRPSPYSSHEDRYKDLPSTAAVIDDEGKSHFFDIDYLHQDKKDLYDTVASALQLVDEGLQSGETIKTPIE